MLLDEDRLDVLEDDSEDDDERECELEELLRVLLELDDSEELLLLLELDSDS